MLAKLPVLACKFIQKQENVDRWSKQDAKNANLRDDKLNAALHQIFGLGQRTSFQ